MVGLGVLGCSLVMARWKAGEQARRWIYGCLGLWCSWQAVEQPEGEPDFPKGASTIVVSCPHQMPAHAHQRAPAHELALRLPHRPSLALVHALEAPTALEFSSRCSPPRRLSRRLRQLTCDEKPIALRREFAARSFCCACSYGWRPLSHLEMSGAAHGQPHVASRGASLACVARSQEAARDAAHRT